MKDVKAKNTPAAHRNTQQIENSKKSKPLMFDFVLIFETFLEKSVKSLFAGCTLVTVVKDESGFGFNVRGQVRYLTTATFAIPYLLCNLKINFKLYFYI